MLAELICVLYCSFSKEQVWFLYRDSKIDDVSFRDDAVTSAC